MSRHIMGTKGSVLDCPSDECVYSSYHRRIYRFKSFVAS